MRKSKTNRGVPDGTGPEGKGPTGRKRPPQKPRREDFDSDREFEQAMTRWNDSGVEKSIFRPTEMVKKSLTEGDMEATGLVLVIVPGELTKAAKLSGVGSSSHAAKLSNVHGNTKSSIPYTGHEERMKLAKMAMARMVAPIPENEREHTSDPVVDSKGRGVGGKAPHSNYSTEVSGMDSQAHSLYGKPTLIVKPSELGASIPEGPTKHTPVRSVRKPKR